MKDDVTIAKCPNKECGAPCELMEGHHTGSWVMCKKCEYCGPLVRGAEQWRNAEAIRLHNALCCRVPVAALEDLIDRESFVPHNIDANWSHS